MWKSESGNPDFTVWQAIKEWIPYDNPDLNRINQERNSRADIDSNSGHFYLLEAWKKHAIFTQR